MTPSLDRPWRSLPGTALGAAVDIDDVLEDMDMLEIGSEVVSGTEDDAGVLCVDGTPVERLLDVLEFERVEPVDDAVVVVILLVLEATALLLLLSPP